MSKLEVSQIGSKAKGSLTKNTLLKLTSRVLVIMAVTSAVSYFHVFGVFKTGALEELKSYVDQRSQIESQYFLEGQSSARNAGNFIKREMDRLLALPSTELETMYWKRVERLPNGVIQHKLTGHDSKLWAGLIVNKWAVKPVITPTEMAFDLAAMHAADNSQTMQNDGKYLNLWAANDDRMGLLWFDGTDWAATAGKDGGYDWRKDGYAPGALIANGVKVGENSAVAYFDAVPKVFMASLIAFNEYNGFLFSTARDASLDTILTNVINKHGAGTKHMLFAGEKLVAHPDHMDAIRESKFEKKFNEFNDPSVIEAYEQIKAQKAGETIAEAPKSDAYLALGKIKGVDWDFVIVYPKVLLSGPAKDLAAFILAVGVLSLLGELATMYFMMRNNIARPLNGFMDATRALAGGNFNVKLDTQRNDELGELGGLFKNMADNIKDHQENLEQKIEVRTLEIAAREKSLKLILDNTGDGFLTAALNGDIQGQTSQSVKDWFGAGEGANKVWSYLFAGNKRFQENFQCIFEELGDTPMFFDINIAQLPQKFSRLVDNETQYFEIEYRPIKDEQDEVQTILLVVKDTTAKVAAEKSEQERLEFVAIFERLLKDKAGFASFVQEINGMLAQLPNCQKANDAVLAKRLIHTVKGNAGVYGINSLSSLCHVIEDGFVAEPETAWSRVPEIETAWKKRMEKIIGMLGTDKNTSIEIPASELDSVIAQVVADASPARVRELLESWKLEPAARKLMRLADAVQATAKKQGKHNVQTKIENGNLRLPPMEFGDFFAQLVHVVRNAVDHGCEAPEARKTAGKSEFATVTLSAVVKGDTLTVIIADDGKGVAWHKIKEKGASLGMKVDTQDDLVNVMFSDGVSTAEAVSETSGRGVGASAARESCLALGGKIRVESAPGKGTQFCFDLPIASNIPGAVKLRKAG